MFHLEYYSDLRAKASGPYLDEVGAAGCEASDVAFEDAGLGQPGEAFADRAGTVLADAFDGLQVVDAGGQELLQVAEVLDQAVDDSARQPGDLGEQAVDARGGRRE